MATTAMMGGMLFDDDVCPVCQTDRYLNPQMRLLVGPCFHKMCDGCIERLFNHGPAPCPTCHQTLRKAAFSAQTFEDLGVEKEVRIRKQMATKFNKRQHDFKTLALYNDYLEQVEELTFKLTNEIDVETTKLTIEKFAAENKDLIKINADRILHESRIAAQQAAAIAQERQRKHEQYLQELLAEQQAKNEDRKTFIQELATSDKAPKEIMAQRQAITLKRTSMRKQEITPTNGTNQNGNSLLQAAHLNNLLGKGSTPNSLSSSTGNSTFSTPNLGSSDNWDHHHDEEMEESELEPMDPIQALYKDVDLGVGYTTSVNNNMAHAGGLQYPLMSSSTGVRDMYIEPPGMGSLSRQAKAGGYRSTFGYNRAIEDAHTALFLPML